MASWELVEAVFDGAVELAGDERESFLDRACGGDAGLRAEVESLLASSGGAREVLRDVVSTSASSLVEEGVAGRMGTRIGAYRVTALVGEGGMGAVYLAERDDAVYRGRVAVKVLHRGLGSPQAVARFRDERQILAQLDHPGIVRLLDGGTTDDGAPFLVMEYVDGVPLLEHVATLDLRGKLEIVIEIAAALQYAHQRLVVHRDVKPGNVLVDRAGRPKLLDFGIARLLDTQGGLGREARTSTGALLLTAEYASPEQALGQQVTVATDVYSLGAVLYHVLTGRPPQTGSASALETLRAICEVDPPRPSAVASGPLAGELAGDLDSIVLKALQKDTARRYPSAAALAEDLRRYLDGRPVSARDATFAYRARKLVARRRGAIAAAAAVFLALSGATVFSVLQARRADAHAREAELQKRALLVEQGREELLAGRPGRALPYLVEALREGADTEGVRFLIAEAARPLQGVVQQEEFPDGIGVLLLSPDRSLVAVAGARVARLYAPTGELVRSLDVRGQIAADARFSPDGAYLAAYTQRVRDVPGSRASLLVWRVDTGELTAEVPLASNPVDVCWSRHPLRVAAVEEEGPTVVAEPGGTVVRALETDLVRSGPGPGCVLSADGARLHGGRRSGGLEVRDVATGAVLATVDLGAPATRLLATADGTRIFAGDARGRIHVLEAGSLRVLRVLSDHQGWIGGGRISDDGRVLATAGQDGIIGLWDTTTGAALRSIVTGVERSAARPGGFDARGARVAGVGRDWFGVWSVATGELLERYESAAAGGHTPHSWAGAMGAVFATDGLLVTASATEVTWRRTDREGPVATTALDALSIRFSHDGRLVATGGWSFARIDDLATGRPLLFPDVGRRPVWDVAFDPADRAVAVVGEDALAAVFPLDGGATIPLVGHTGAVDHVAFDPAGARVLTSGDGDHTARVWNAHTGALLLTIPHPDRVMSAVWMRGGRGIVTAGWDGRLRFFDERGALQRTLAEPAQFLDLAVSPDGSRLATCAHDGRLTIWDLASGTRALSLEGHAGPATSVSWSPAGGLLLSSTDQGFARLWDSATGQLLGERDRRSLMQAVWSADGSRIATAGPQGTAVWDVHRDPRGAAELEAFAAARSPWLLRDGVLVFTRGEPPSP